jgi:hypothetical protein
MDVEAEREAIAITRLEIHTGTHSKTAAEITDGATIMIIRYRHTVASHAPDKGRRRLYDTRSDLKRRQQQRISREAQREFGASLRGLAPDLARAKFREFLR